MAITDQLRPNLMFPGGLQPSQITRKPYSGDGAQIIERPFIYVYDGTGLTDGTSLQDQVVPIHGDSDFALRRICGLQTVADTLRLFDSSGAKDYMDAAEFLPDNYVPSREIGYPLNGLIRFNLGNIGRSLIACGADPIYTSYIYFQGVKLQQTSVRPYATPYEFKRLPYTYSVSFSLDWRHYATAPLQEAPRPQYLNINNYDFELHKIQVCFSDGTLDTTGFFQLLLYDYNGHATATAPIGVNYLNESAANLNSVFPVPPLLFPRDSQMRWDVRSMICPSDATFPKNYIVQFVGMQRYPVGTGGAV